MPKSRFDGCSNGELSSNPHLEALGRRAFLTRCGSGLGNLALAWLLQQDGWLTAADKAAAPLAPKQPHLPAKAKSCIFLFMSGAPGQMDTFDPKPKLAELHGKPITRVYGSLEKRLYVGSPFKFAKYGQSGMEISEIFPQLATCADDLAVVRSLHTSFQAHTTATFFMNTGAPLPGSPSMGAWAIYGLGTESQDLPAFVVLPDTRSRIFGGAINWASGYLPAFYQGTLFNPQGVPVVDLMPPQSMSTGQQKANLSLLNRLNTRYLRSNPRNGDLWGRMKNYELAFRMQFSVPESLDLESEPERIREMYGLNDKITEPMGRKCLMARRMVERGVRFIEIYSSGWDAHQNVEGEYRSRGRETDQPLAALLKDLKQRGLLDQTLVVWGGEFGRTADNSMDFFRSGPGRDHNKEAMLMWFAGGGIKGGTVLGNTDELGIKAIEDRYHVHDVHATILQLMGLEDMKLTFYHAGRDQRLTGPSGGRTIQQILA